MTILAESAIVNELPLSPVGYALIALAGFAALLALTFAFKSVGHRHTPGSRPGSGSGH